jgi:2-polyprenyl-6-hydroxyphenyl methylase / 3-demethylubiquinone-9 3-methyltransferase
MGSAQTSHSGGGAALKQAGGAAAPGEIARFDALATRWWDPHGPMAPLHAMNPLRTAWIDARLPGPTRLLDVGCGAGLAAEALARRGHSVLGIDAAGETLAAGRAHAAGQELTLEYRLATTGDLVREGCQFAAITALEVIEHVPDPAGFLHDLAALLEPGGRLFVSTLNRTGRSLLTAKIGAEYVLRLLPAGTHDWRRFITPAELARDAREAGLRLESAAGMSFDPLRRQWRESRDLRVNYIAAFVR